MEVVGVEVEDVVEVVVVEEEAVAKAMVLTAPMVLILMDPMGKLFKL